MCLQAERRALRQEQAWSYEQGTQRDWRRSELRSEVGGKEIL